MATHKILVCYQSGSLDHELCWWVPYSSGKGINIFGCDVELAGKPGECKIRPDLHSAGGRTCCGRFLAEVLTLTSVARFSGAKGRQPTVCRGEAGRASAFSGVAVQSGGGALVPCCWG